MDKVFRCYVEKKTGFDGEAKALLAELTGPVGVSGLTGLHILNRYDVEGLARAVEQGIFTLDMLLVGVPALPAAAPLEPCFQALGFTKRPADVETVKDQYKRMAKVMHPDAGGSKAAFNDLIENYTACLGAMEE